jgi:hypothetical protein
MQFKPDKRTATPANSAAGGLRQPMSLGRNRVPLEPLTVSSLYTVPAGVDEPVAPGLVNSFALDSMPSLLSVIVYLNFFRVHTTERLWVRRKPGALPAIQRRTSIPVTLTRLPRDRRRLQRLDRRHGTDRRPRTGTISQHPGHLRNRQHPRGPRLRRTARQVLAQGPDALPARPRRASNERAHRPRDADHDHPPSPAPSRCQPLNPSTCRHRITPASGRLRTAKPNDPSRAAAGLLRAGGRRAQIGTVRLASGGGRLRSARGRA